MGLGIDVGGTLTDIVSFENGKFNHKESLKTSDFLKNPELIEKYRDGVFAIAGWIKNGRIIKTPNIPEFREDLFKNKKIENDANCFAVYAMKFTGKENILALTLGTGIGTGIIINSRLYRGTGIAGEIGHSFVDGNEICVCSGKGHLETFFSGWAIKKRFGRELKREEIIEFEGFRVLCREVAKAVTLLDPEAVVFGGRISSNLEDEDFELIYDYLPEEFRPEIKVIKDPLAVAKGAAILAGDGYEYY